jgi:NTP pyrophosphatase (non-canonical NTP hydrolase)
MNFHNYQAEATETAVYPGQGEFTGLCYAALGVNGEAGEVAEQVKKMWRNEGHLTPERRIAIIDELGDVLWYISQVATELSVDLDDVATLNLEKLAGRRARDEIKVHE